MKVEIPKFERCCCCLPLRRGILTFAYLNLFITIFFGVLQVSLWVYYYYPFMKLQSSMMVMYRGIVIEAQMFFVIALHVLDVVFNIILIVGAHMTNAKLMRWYYFYQLTMMIANFFAMLVIYTGISKVSGLDTYPTLSECAVAFIGFVVQIYLLLLVHSELNKLRYQERRSSFVNHMAEHINLLFYLFFSFFFFCLFTFFLLLSIILTKDFQRNITQVFVEHTSLSIRIIEFIKMLIDIPVCKRCCFCIPLRGGLITWGYFNLCVGFLLLTGSIFGIIKKRNVPESEKYKITTDFIVIIFVTMIVGILEIVLSLIFIVGCHKKNVKLIKTFYYYNILLLGLTSILTVYGGISAVIYTVDGFKRGLNANFLMYFLSIDIGLLLANFALQLYILLVVRSEIIKLSSDCQFRFANIGSEAECTMTIEGLTKENRVQNIHANPVITKGSEIKGLVGREDNVN
ncbi:unnamed protein product [Arctia plantaginis]|uniref:Uncharacterized protein n=1 Tax=Arctia plantaginis TaxID=874455 RepID=A0A8S0Z6G8_ARCPL|nr:unnamed protein product [Arctia plantaginis]